MRAKSQKSTALHYTGHSAKQRQESGPIFRGQASGWAGTSLSHWNRSGILAIEDGKGEVRGANAD